MKTLSSILLSLVLTLSFATDAFAASDKSKKAAQARTDIFEKVAHLTSEESAEIYQILLDKEQQSNLIRSKFKDDKKAIKAKLKPIIKSSNRKIKDIIGSKRMSKVNAYVRELRKKN